MHLLIPSIKSINRARIDTDAYCNLRFLRCLHNLSEHHPASKEVPRVDTDRVNTLLDRQQGKLPIIMDVSDQGYMNALLDSSQGLSIYLFGNGYACQFAANLLQTMNLGHCGLNITRIHRSHGLHTDRCLSTNQHISNMDLSGWSPLHLISPTRLQSPVTHTLVVEPVTTSILENTTPTIKKP